MFYKKKKESFWNYNSSDWSWTNYSLVTYWNRGNKQEIHLQKSGEKEEKKKPKHSRDLPSGDYFWSHCH